ncbi:hypothetical protein NQ176_g671 [Zarea fungicola]|uniref:Uncharacterized protein n=1 Tax=Zarea fungicola TaxID=93591 RepID=A0ACC1NYU5_9HYPO|nr:hypothetical protein NQ176_g671 [Lecanicillium fungicola]
MSIPAENPAAYAPAQTALLLLDYHNLLVDMIQPQDTKEKLCGHVQKLVQTARASGSPIVHALVSFAEEPLARSKLRSYFEKNYKPLLASSPQSCLELEVLTDCPASESHEIIVTKTPGCISALKTPKLLKFLKEEHGVESLIICGLITSGAVLSTARESADLGFATTVVKDGCWDLSTEAHDVVLGEVLPMTAWVVNTEAAVKLLNGKSKAL